jgi:excisionase family DNA binding protein
MKELNRDWLHARSDHQDDDDWRNGSPGTSLSTPSSLREFLGLAETSSQPLLVTVEEAARLLRIGRTTMFELIGNGEIKSIRLGRRRLIARKSLESFIDELSLP